MDNTRGTVTVSKKAVKQLVLYATEKCDGVLAVRSNSRKKNFSDLIFKKNEIDGIVVNTSRKGVFVDVSIDLKSGADSEDVCKAISVTSKDFAQKIGISIAEVNVYINDTGE